MPEARAALSDTKRALLEKRLRGAAAANGAGAKRIPRRENRGPAPLSFMQQRMWFLSQFALENPFANIHYALRLHFRVDESVLERSLNELIKRHESLRTTFTVLDGEPMQVVVPELHVRLRVVETVSEAEALALAREEAREPFDLVQGPLLRASLVPLATAESLFLLTI